MTTPARLDSLTGDAVSGLGQLRPTPLEIASHCVIGSLPVPGVTGPLASPLDELERSLLVGLHRPPCLVSFSGGMDSSFVLAVAARLARREGLPSPVPVTWRFSGAPHADESAWQERVLATLPVDDWQLLQADDDLDLLGPVAQRLLRRYGMLHPANLHLHLPIIEAAAGGSLLTGAGGDQILTGWTGSVRRARPLRHSVRHSLRQNLPARLVTGLDRSRGRDPFPWLQADVSRRLSSQLLLQFRAQPRPLDERIGWHAARRDLQLTCSSLTAVAADHDVTLVNPLVAPRFLAALREDVGSTTELSRADLLERLSDGRFPDVITALRPKARFLEVFLREPTRSFVRTWDGSGVDGRQVDIEALRDIWSRWPIPGGTAGLVQQAWLAGHSTPSPRTDVPA